MQADTMVPEPADPQSLNRYSYVRNNPLGFVDPSGHFTEQEIRRYLYSQYGSELWEQYLSAWASDRVFWDMLLKADYGDVLSAPTAHSLGEGTFVVGIANRSFEFISVQGHRLRDFQGYGPYQLHYSFTGEEKASVDRELTSHPIELDTSRLNQVWHQPLYRYDENGPEFTGYYRRASYQKTGSKIHPLAGDSVPWILGGVLGSKIVEGFCPVCGFAVEAASFATALNNAVSYQHQLQVDLVDYSPQGPQYDYCFNPPQEALDLLK